ncbi:response regulator transcription factor [Pedobacter duraquae]|uniref:Two-component system response regulator VicR n=1 Tax=Pedobacter duraquae TaxID=425511 RepID=A0A4R6IDB9_9SPHI|nr:response regulator [Pedobacter duraquae]TDO19621.1 two-component system response regulator VicR [Pedobacter duraquae]
MMKRILVVEDDPDILEVIQLALELNNYKVFPLMTGRPVFRIIDDFKPDLIIMDIRLDGMDGRAIVKEIRSRPETADIPVLMASAEFSEDYIMREHLLGNDYLAKPFEIAVLLKKIKNLLEASPV